MRVLVSGAAGFIGMHVAEALLNRGDVVVGLDNLNAYYDVELKKARLARLSERSRFKFELMDVSDLQEVLSLFRRSAFDRVVHLAAQAGVRYSVDHPHVYAQANLVGFLNILEAARHFPVSHLVYASTSSVYGRNTRMPFRESDGVDHPVSLYAATKKANELMAHTYSHLYRIPTSGLRFFTVYGPWGRPDMGIFKFTKSIIRGEPIEIYNEGKMLRDFTFVDDIAAAVLAVLDRPAESDVQFDSGRPDPAVSDAPYRILNIGNQQPVPLLDFIAAIERAVGRTAVKKLLPMQPGDVLATHADMGRLEALIGRPVEPTPIGYGVSRFVDWYRDFYRA